MLIYDQDRERYPNSIDFIFVLQLFIDFEINQFNHYVTNLMQPIKTIKDAY
jgi:hypothetical protein